MKITKEQILKMDRAAMRQSDIDNGLNINHHRVFKSKKTYTRKVKHKNTF